MCKTLKCRYPALRKKLDLKTVWSPRFSSSTDSSPEFKTSPAWLISLAHKSGDFQWFHTNFHFIQIGWFSLLFSIFCPCALLARQLELENGENGAEIENCTAAQNRHECFQHWAKADAERFFSGIFVFLLLCRGGASSGWWNWPARQRCGYATELSNCITDHVKDNSLIAAAVIW